jgi:uncharacterized protein YigA (DUF484 family)
MTPLPDAHEVALYLTKHPDFFEHHPELIAGLKLTTALGGRTVSLQDRQIEVLRDKIRQLELKLANLTRIAGSNETIMSNFHQWILRLVDLDAQAELPDLLLETLRESFDVPAATLRLWNLRPEHAQAWFAESGPSEARTYADSHAQPVCGPAAEQPGVVWLEPSEEMKSAALIPLRKPGSEQSFGLLVLGSPDSQRFAAELATDFLSLLGETASAHLQSLVT